MSSHGTFAIAINCMDGRTQLTVNTHCGGGCAASAYNSLGDINAIDSNHCVWVKAMFDLWIKGEEF